MKVKIYRPTKSAMQSGLKNTKKWLLAPIEEKNNRSINPLMGWTSVGDTNSQIKLTFDSKDEAIKYALHRNFEYEVEEPKISSVKRKSYAENFTN